MTAILPLQNPPRIRGGFETIVVPMLGRDGEVLPVAEWRKGVSGKNLPAGEFFTNTMIGGSWGDPDNGDVKPDSVLGDEVEFKPSAVGIKFRCDMNGHDTERGDVVAAEVKNEIERRLWSLIARHIQVIGTSIDCPGGEELNPTFQSAATLPDGYVDNAPGDIEGVMQGLLDMVCAGAHTDPVFLVPYSWKTHFTRRGIVRWDDEQQAYIALGTHRVAFDCIDNVGPGDGVTTSTNPDGSEVWIYAMIPPKVNVEGETARDAVAVREELTNRYRVRGERQFITWFDTAHISAAKATIL